MEKRHPPLFQSVSSRLVEELAFFTKGFFIVGTAIMEVKPAHHGSDFHTHVGDVSDPDWELVVLALRMQERLVKDAKAYVATQESIARGLSDKELSERLLCHRPSESVRKEAARRLEERTK